MTIGELLTLAQSKLIDVGFNKQIAKQDCEEILLHVCHFNKSDLILKSKEQVNKIIASIFEKSIQERLKHRPIQYITNNSIFFGYNFFVNENCLIPRIDGEVLVEKAIEIIKQDKKNYFLNDIKILDLCCGSGCLGISLVKYLLEKRIFNKENIELTLIDKSSQAIQVARINCQKHNIIAKFIINDILLNGIGNEKYNIVLCNPPYIETSIINTLDDEVKNFEPHIALDGGDDGLKFYRFLSQIIKQNLHHTSKAVFEIAYNQGTQVSGIFNNSGFNTKIVKDYGNKDRCIIVSL